MLVTTALCHTLVAAIYSWLIGKFVFMWLCIFSALSQKKGAISTKGLFNLVIRVFYDV
jgi:hypothetical protein